MNWEYKVVRKKFMRHEEDLQTFLNEMNSEGWEFVESCQFIYWDDRAFIFRKTKT